MFDKMKQLMEVKKQADRLKRELDAEVIEVDEVDGIRISISGSQDFRSIQIDENMLRTEDISKIENEFESLKSDNKIIVTTEKDSIRLKDRTDLSENLKSVLYYLPVKVNFLGGEDKSFNKRIFDYVGENKSNRELHKRKNKSLT